MYDDKAHEYRRLTDFDTFEISGIEDGDTTILFRTEPVVITPKAMKSLYRSNIVIVSCTTPVSSSTTRSKQLSKKISSSLTDRTKISTDREHFICNVCKKVFLNKSSMKHCLRLHCDNGRKSYECDLCKAKFSDKSSIIVHLKYSVCQKSFAKKASVSNSTAVCKVNAYKPSSRTDRTKASIDQKRLARYVCTKMSPNELYHKRRLRTNRYRRKSYECDFCKTNFLNKSSIVFHFKYGVCEKSFSYNTPMSDLTVIRNGQIHHKCDICEKLYSSKSSLLSHYKVHYDKKTIGCDTCKKMFWNTSEMIRHLKCHRIKKPFKCNVCFKGFSGKQSLNRHIIVHTRYKVFVCNICEKQFVYRSSFLNHIKMHTKNNNSSC